MTLESKLLLDFYIGTALQVVLKPFALALGWLLRRDHDLSRCSDVTIIKMLGGGSLVIAYPDLLAVKNLPRIRRLRLLTTPAVKPFGEILNIFDEIIVIRDNSLLLCLKDSLIALGKLFRTDAIVDFEIHSRLTTLFALFSCARNRIGFYTADSFWRRHLSNHLLFCNIANGVYCFYDQIAHLFGARVPPFEEVGERFRVERSIRPRAGFHDGHAIGVAPCCSELGKERMMLGSELVQVLARKIRANYGQSVIYFLGGKADRPYIDSAIRLLQDECPGITVVDKAGRLTLSESVDLLGTLDELVCIDSALLHFGRLMGVRTTSFWGPTDPKTRLRPASVSKDIICYQRLPCSPCVHMAQKAPCNGNNLCMRLAVNPDFTQPRNVGWLAFKTPPRESNAVIEEDMDVDSGSMSRICADEISKRSS